MVFRPPTRLHPGRLIPITHSCIPDITQPDGKSTILRPFQQMHFNNTYIIGCDWGSSAFRLRLIDLASGSVTTEIRSDMGVKAIHRIFQESPENGSKSMHRQYRMYLGSEVQRLLSPLGIPATGIPLVVSGMASSSIGICELPYATLPFLLSGEDAVIRHMPADDSFSNDMLLVSGVRSEGDVMRGEETEMMGLLPQLRQVHEGLDDALLLLPGTHSKHIRISGDSMIDFRTFMTGELFSMLCAHSVLRESVSMPGQGALKGEDEAALRLGVERAADGNLLNDIFSVRTRHLLHGLAKSGNAYHLSGILLGHELQAISDEPDGKIILHGASPLSDLYAIALHHLGMSARVIRPDRELADRASVAGQLLLFNRSVASSPEGV